MSAWFMSRCSKTVLKQKVLPKWTHRLFSAHVGVNSPEYIPLGKNCPEYVPLLSTIEDRRSEARRSLLVQVKDHLSADDLYQYCSTKYGPVKGLHFYKNTSSQIFTNFFIIEFEHCDSVSGVLRQGQHTHVTKQGGAPPVPVCSPFLWFSGSQTPSRPRTLGPTSSLIPVHHCELPSDEALKARIAATQDVSSQMEQLWQAEAMTDVSQRSRFLVCRQIELAISGMFPFCGVLPFGSSVNSHGRHSCDLDMVLKLDSDVKEDSDNRLVFHAKGAVYGGERAQVQKYCDEISKIIQSFLPGCQDVQKVLNARVPIIKYSQQLAGLECDLQMSSDSGLHMSCLLHLWGHSDWRVRPLVAMVRKWAKAQSLVLNVRPTHYFTNFTLTMLVVFYLQAHHKMIPTLGVLLGLSTPQDCFTKEEGLQMDFLHDINNMKEQLNHCYNSPVSLEELLKGFFQFYAVFDFTSCALCTISGEVVGKRTDWRNSSAMDITNPLEPNLNVSYNLNKTAVNLFKEKCSDGLQKLEMLEKTKEATGVLQRDGFLWLLSKVNDMPKRKKNINLADLGLLDPIETEKPLAKNVQKVKNNVANNEILPDVMSGTVNKTSLKINHYFGREENKSTHLPKNEKIIKVQKIDKNIKDLPDVMDSTSNKKSIKINEYFGSKNKSRTKNNVNNRMKKVVHGSNVDIPISDSEMSAMSEEERLEHLKERYLRTPKI